MSYYFLLSIFKSNFQPLIFQFSLYKSGYIDDVEVLHRYTNIIPICYLHQHPVQEKISLHRGLLSFKTIILKGLWQDKVNVNLKKRRWQHWSINQVVALNFLQSCHSSNLPSTCNRRGYYYDYLFICFACSSLIAALFQGPFFYLLGVLPFSKSHFFFFFFSSSFLYIDEEIKIQIYLQEVSFPVKQKNYSATFFCFKYFNKNVLYVRTVRTDISSVCIEKIYTISVDVTI